MRTRMRVGASRKYPGDLALSNRGDPACSVSAKPRLHGFHSRSCGGASSTEVVASRACNLSATVGPRGVGASQIRGRLAPRGLRPDAQKRFWFTRGWDCRPRSRRPNPRAIDRVDCRIARDASDEPEARQQYARLRAKEPPIAEMPLVIFFSIAAADAHTMAPPTNIKNARL